MIVEKLRSALNNKSLATNLVCALIFALGWLWKETPVGAAIMYGGIFGLSGAVTNWLAVYMIFERIPGLFGSGIIILKFESFKVHIREIILNTFFEEKNLARQSSKIVQVMMGGTSAKDMAEKIDPGLIFGELVSAVMESSLGGMLGMFGGSAVLEKLREPFTRKIRERLPDLLERSGVIDGGSLIDDQKIQRLQQMLTEIIDDKLQELTPQMVKELVEKIIRDHMGWLVIWGGVFGFLIGAVCAWFF